MEIIYLINVKLIKILCLIWIDKTQTPPLFLEFNNLPLYSHFYLCRNYFQAFFFYFAKSINEILALVNIPNVVKF